MDIKGRSVLVLGGWGLVGSAICRKLMEEKPRRIIVTSLNKNEALEAVQELHKEYPKAGNSFFVPWWGNIFLPYALKDMPREKILSSEKLRQVIMHDMIDEMTDEVLHRSSLYHVLEQFKPDVIIDCINSATAIAYQDIFHSSRDVMRQIRMARTKKKNSLFDSVEKLICTLYLPQLIRHVQILYQGMKITGSHMYVKIGTSGTGGMGLNIPYTHSEERPSRVLLSKSSIAGAQTLLLFLMGRTPDGPIIKEIKPTGLIGWKKIDYGEIQKKRQPIKLFDCPPEKAVKLGTVLELKKEHFAEPTGATLHSVFIDTGENGVFSRGEFEAITTPGQMEFVTPEEIAESVVFEIKGGNTGHDIINALDNATLEPTYRAGYLFHTAMKRLQKLEEKHHVDSVAFEMLGPPRVSKLLYESYLLKMACRDMRTVSKTPPETLSKKLYEIITANKRLRSQIISIGIPILPPDGKSLIRGDEIKIPPFRGDNRVKCTQRSLDLWAHDGWVDLRTANMETWRNRCHDLLNVVENIPAAETGSQHMLTMDYWDNFPEIDPGKMVGWIFTNEEKGKRMKA
jgi:hypothetical protein